MDYHNSGLLDSSDGVSCLDAIFEETLNSAGFHFSHTKQLNTLHQEQSLVVRDLEKVLVAGSEDVNRFINHLRSLCADENYFRTSLLPTHLKKSHGDMKVEIQQESLFRILLRVNSLQKEVADILLDEITNIAAEEADDTSFLRLLLNPLRFLPYIKDAENLTTRLLDIIDVATFTAQLEIIESVPDIIPDNQYSKTAKQLSILLDENEQLSAAIIDCLNALNLDSDIRLQVHDRILARIISGNSLKIFPIFLSFLMTDCKAPNLPQTLMKIRNALDTIMTSSDKSQDRESNIILIFNRLQTLAVAPKIVLEAWVNLIQAIRLHSDHKPIDILLLIMLHSTVKFRRKPIEQVFRKKISANLFKITILEPFFEHYLPQQLLKDYFNSIVEIGCNLLRTSNDSAIKDFVTKLFVDLFNKNETQLIYRQQLLDNLIVLTGSVDGKSVGSVLNILTHFNKTKLERFASVVMRLLEKLEMFDLADVKTVFEILCGLTCGEKADESLSGLKDELHMIVRKQLCSCKKIVKHRGIISAVEMAKHIASTIEDQDDFSVSEDSIYTLANLPQGNPRDAACLLKLTSTATSNCPDLLGLYYDQLASMLMTTENLDKHFLYWLYETITNDFQNIFVTETILNNINDLEFSMQYLLNTTDETDTPIGVNIAELTIAPGKQVSIMLLAPHFRLLRLLHYRQHNGDLSTIDALLGCGVILPSTDLISELDSDQVVQVADCLFHCANWFREIISGFVTQKSRKLRMRVLQRLENLIEIERLLFECLRITPEHKLPISYFDNSFCSLKQQAAASPSKEVKIKPPRKKFKSNAIVNEGNASVSVSQIQTKPKGAGKKPAAVSDENGISFREMDTDLIILLKYNLKFDDDDDMALTQSSSLSISQLIFILKDFVSKLHILTRFKGSSLCHLSTVAPSNLIKDCVVIFPNVDKHLKTIIKKLNHVLELTDQRHDLPEMFTEDTTNLKKVFDLILESFYLTFSWSEFQHSCNLEILRNILRPLCPEQSQSANRLIYNFINRLSGFSDQCLHLSHAVNLIKTMESLYSLTSETADIKKKIVVTSSKLLGQRWYSYRGDLDKGKTCNKNIQILVKSYLGGASTKTICGLIGTLQEQSPNLKTKEDCLHMLAAIDKQNFPIFYFELCSALHTRVKEEISSLTNNEHLVLWRTVTLSMQGLMTIAKADETKTTLACFLKKSISILKIFLSQGIPILEIMLRSKPDEVVAILKTMQSNTRFLHHLCCYSKLMKEPTLMAFVPQFRLTLETLVYRVKAALVANNCEAAFWMGNLRNKDLQGEDILSQSSVTTDSSREVTENDTEELLAGDDSDSDVFNDEPSSSCESKSASDVYD